MQRWGRDKAGKQRWFCLQCGKTALRFRKDIISTNRERLFKTWITGTQSLSEFARSHKATRRTLERWFEPFWRSISEPIIPATLAETWLSVDATYLGGRKDCVMIGRSGKEHVVWGFAEYETLAAWLGFFNKLPKAAVVIFDGQKGLI